MVLAVDEKSQMQALDRTAPVLPMMPTTPQRQTHDYVRHGTTSLFAALDMATGRVIGQTQRQHRHQEFLRFLKTIDKATPSGLDLHLIVDNYATHKTPQIQQWLVRHPRFHLHFTPTYSSWLNLVERWFGELTNRKLRRSTHRSVAALEADVKTWIEAWNADPKPFVWTKTADQILETIAAYCGRINDSGHEIGARYGTRLLSLRVLRRRQDRIDAARATLARRGGPAVFGGRFVAFLRAVMPFLAGTSHMRYPRFLAYNAAGGLAWGIGSVLLGYVAGNSYTAVEHTFGRATALIAAALVVIAILAWSIRRHRRERTTRPDNRPGPASPED